MSSVRTRKVISSVSFALSLAFVVAMALLYPYNILLWSRHPDFGFGFRLATGVNVVGVVGDPAIEAGMRVGDRILKVNGQPFATYEELTSARRFEPEEENTYLVERNGEQFEATIVNIPTGFKTSFIESGFLYLLGLCYAIIGALVFFMKPHHKTSWIFFLFASVLGLFIMFLFTSGKMTPLWLEAVHIFSYCLVPVVFIHLAFTFPEERGFMKKSQHAPLLLYVIPLVLFLWFWSSAHFLQDAPRTWLEVEVAFMVVGVLLFLSSCLHLWLTSSSQIVKLRSKIILLGFAVAASVPLLDLVINALFNFYIVPNFNYYLPFLIIFPLAIGYSVVKHDLFDIDAIIKRTYGYVLTTGAIAGLYGLFVLVSNLAFGRLEVTKSTMFPLIFILAVVFLFNPVRNRLQKFIDRIFYRLEYDYQETVQKISETMRSLLNLDKIGKAMMETALGTMFIDSGGVMLLNPKKEVYECIIAAGKREKSRAGTGEAGGVESVDAEGRRSVLRELALPANDPLIQKIGEKKKEVTIYDIQEDPFFEDDRESCRQAFEQMEATLIIPVIYEDRLTGLISLGDKKSGKFYRREDINLLNILANQGAVAIENAMMVEDVIEKERMEEELSIARDLQTSMLPATCPEIEGFEIAALSTPAKEVGGDFFDFIDMGENKLGLVIADVTGKSVSGALVMSASRSVFRMLSEEELTVGEIMVRANRRMKKDITSGMFVALLYAVLDAKEQTVSLCSAGQTQPIHLSAENGEARILETAGDTFPLGILEDADYQETRLQLAPGDKVVFYTDGIVEEMNKQKEIFGFERLLAVVREARSINADSLLKEIIKQVSGFAGGVAQHDDLTVIVLNVTGRQ